MAYKRKNPQAKWVLPDVIDPPDHICFKIPVPNNPYHLAAFRGALLSLASAAKWGDDPAHTALDVAKVWRDIYDQVVATACENPSGPDLGILIEDDAMAIHVDCDCKVTIDCCDGTTKQLVTTDMINQPGQPGGSGSAPPPAPGGCQTEHLTLNPASMATLTFPVNAGDTVQVLNAAGSWNDGSGFAGWYCPDGKKFFGSCVPGSQTTNGSDPLPAKFYMQIIGVLNGTTYFDPFTPYTIPSGVVGGRVEFQANRPALTSAWGNIAFDAKYCNNSTPPVATWCYEFNFAANAFASLVSGTWTYTGGTGYESTPDTTFQTFIMNWGAGLTITEWTVVQDIVGSNSNPLGLWHDDDSVVDPGISGTTVGATTTWFWAGTSATVKGMKWTSHGLTGTPSIIRSVKIKGTGAAPLGASTC